MFQKLARKKVIGIAFSASLLLSGCLGDLFSSNDGDKSDNTDSLIRVNYPIWCQTRDPNYPFIGCWISPRCDYQPRDFIGTNDPTDDATEDYWFKSVTAYVSDPGYKTLINGQSTELDGRWFLGGLWYTNATCTGEPMFYTDNFVSMFYRMYGSITTLEGMNGTVLQIIGSASNGETNENLRSYMLVHTMGEVESPCFYGQDIYSPETEISDDQGETVYTGLDLDNCFTLAIPGSQAWMVETLSHKEIWENFYLYQGNNIWVNGWDNTVYGQ